VDKMGFREKMLQDRDQVREFFGSLFVGLCHGLHGGRHMLFSPIHKSFFSLPLYRSLRIRTVWEGGTGEPQKHEGQGGVGDPAPFFDQPLTDQITRKRAA